MADVSPSSSSSVEISDATARETPREDLGRTILTPDQKTRVFISSTLNELATERLAARNAITSLRLAPVYFGHGARPHPPPAIYRAMLHQCPIFVGIYWNEYGQPVPGLGISGIEDEFNLSKGKDRLIYVKQQTRGRDTELEALIRRIRDEENVSYVKFSATEELFELIANDLALLQAERFADSTTASLVSSIPRLPRPLSPIVGRSRELAELDPILRNDAIRLLTLVGPGGVGKTHLSLEAALTVEDQFSDGAAFVDLSDVSDPDLVLSTIIAMVGETIPIGQTAIEFLRTYFADKQFLLILDNFDHLVAAVDQIADLLQRCRGFKVLATSRVALRMQGEREFEVMPLLLPDPNALASLEDIANVESVALFLQAVRERDPDFQFNNANARAVAEICVRLDGLPLAIRLAAARLRTFADPNVLLERLEARLPILNLGDRDAPARQKTMRDAIRWSYDLLDNEAQARFRWLSVFPGGFTEDAAQFVTERSGAASIPILDGLDALVDGSLIEVDPGWDGNPRFQMLQTIREFGLEQLNAQGNLNSAECAMAEYFRDRTLALAKKHRGNPHRNWMTELESEIENLRSALIFARTSSDSGLLVRLAWNLWRFWNVRGFVKEGRGWLDIALTQLNGTPDSSVKTYLSAQPRLRGDNRITQGRLSYSRQSWRHSAQEVI